jgi:uncharacterized protein YjbJ (UPF0337 family)
LACRAPGNWRVGNLNREGRLPIADRTQRAEGKAEEIRGRIKREAGFATDRPGTEARGAAEEAKGKAKNAVGKARSAVKRQTR